jgi:glycosyltransferase involved in cell wall biosynthesis
MEVIIVDDGSEDETLSIAKDYANKMDMKVSVFHHEWKGLGPSRNVVVDNACGDYIIWVDADMTIPKDHVKKQVEFMQHNPNVGIGKARYGLLPEEKVVTTLEIVPFLVFDSRNGSLDARAKLPGTGGAIYRVRAIRAAGGFDNSITRGGEDTDAARRVRAAGWLISRSPTVFYEKGRETWQGLWAQYFQHGCALLDIYRKNRSAFSIYRMNPIGGFLNGALYVVDAYRITGNKAVLLLPFHFAFKMTAWCVGFSRAYVTRASR